MVARVELHFPQGETANLLRGRLGKALYDCPGMYQRLFAPHADSGPSGLRDSPRPFVLRVRDLAGVRLDGIHLAPGDSFEIGVNLFQPLIETVRDALCAATSADCAGIEGTEPLRLSFESGSAPVRRVRVRFLTPTALKPSDQPEFGVLFARIRDRVSTLRALYGGGPLEIDFQGMGERARAVRMSRCEIRHVDTQRVSRNTGQRHALGGFVGVAEYEGDLAEFVPYLEAARYTGVGRQTVWGNGEIDWEIL